MVKVNLCFYINFRKYNFSCKEDRYSHKSNHHFNRNSRKFEMLIYAIMTSTAIKESLHDFPLEYSSPINKHPQRKLEYKKMTIVKTTDKK